MSTYVSQSDAEARLGISEAVARLKRAKEQGEYATIAPTSVYIICSPPFIASVKVGIAKNPKSRLRELQCGNARTLGLFDAVEVSSRELARDIEVLTQERFADKRRRGEWFDVDRREVRAWIRDLVEAVR